MSDQEVRLTVVQHQRLKTIEAALEGWLTNRQAAHARAAAFALAFSHRRW